MFTDNKEDSYIWRGALSNIYDIFFISSVASSLYAFTAQKKKKKNWIIIIHRHIWKWMAAMKWNGNHIIILTSSRLTFMEHLSKGRLNHYGTVGLMVKIEGNSIRTCILIWLGGFYVCTFYTCTLAKYGRCFLLFFSHVYMTNLTLCLTKNCLFMSPRKGNSKELNCFIQRSLMAIKGSFSFFSLVPLITPNVSVSCNLQLHFLVLILSLSCSW